MAKLSGALQRIFGGSLTPAANICQIGSTAAGAPVYSGNLVTLQALARYLTGFKDQIVNVNSPALQEMNALFYLITSQIAYQQQAGIWEWDATIIYYTGSFTNVAGVQYTSLQDNNVNHAVTDGAWWTPTSTDGSSTVKLWAGTVVPAGWLACNGASLVRASYPALFAAIGTTYGFADGTHFNIPDLRGRVPVGLGTGDATGATNWTAGRKAGAETHQLTAAELPVVAGPEGSNADNGDVGSLVVTAASQANGTHPASFGADAAHNNLQPSLGLQYIIKT